jgi:tripartite-type tricarboxylate transporter receptor subunit TctC
MVKVQPGQGLLGTAGPGNINEIAGVLFQKRTSSRFGFVPYRGGAPAAQDMVAGQIDLTIVDPTTSLPQVRAGNIKALAVSVCNVAQQLRCSLQVPVRAPQAGVPQIGAQRQNAGVT